MEFALAIGASYVLNKCGFTHIYSNTKPNTATYFSRDDLTVSNTDKRKDPAEAIERLVDDLEKRKRGIHQESIGTEKKRLS